MNKKQKSLTNKGFSLVELIIVIAIMAVLVGVLAPQFIKYVEQSRRSKDIQAAANLQTAYVTDVADATIDADLGTAAAPVKIDGTNKPSTVATAPTISGNLTAATAFYAYVDVDNGTCQIFVGTDAAPTAYDLTNEITAGQYKTAVNP